MNNTCPKNCILLWCFGFEKLNGLHIGLTGGTSPDTENDFLLAQMIQLEYDKEYDRTIDSMEKRYNGESKGIYAYLSICKSVCEWGFYACTCIHCTLYNSV